MIRNERRWLKEQAAARNETKAQDEVILRRRTPLERAFKSLEFGLDDTAYWQLPSGYQLVLMYDWPDEHNDFTPSYDVDIRGYGHIDITKCPLYYKYDRYSFSNMSSTDVVALATWIEKYAPINERYQK